MLLVPFGSGVGSAGGVVVSRLRVALTKPLPMALDVCLGATMARYMAVVARAVEANDNYLQRVGSKSITPLVVTRKFPSRALQLNSGDDFDSAENVKYALYEENRSQQLGC